MGLLDTIASMLTRAPQQRAEYGPMSDALAKQNASYGATGGLLNAIDPYILDWKNAPEHQFARGEVGFTPEVADRLGVAIATAGGGIGKKGVPGYVEDAATREANFKKWFGDSPAIPEDLYHGTTFDIRGDVLRGGASEYSRLSTKLGPHVTPNPEMANTFAKAIDKGPDGGRVLSGKSNASRVYDLPQPMNSRGEFRHDDWAVGEDATSRLFNTDKDLFVKWATGMRRISADEAGKMFDDGLSGKLFKDVWDEKSLKWVPDKNQPITPAGYAKQYSPYSWNPIVDEMSAKYRDLLRSEGYDAIRYKNTNKVEFPEGSDPTAYILLNPSGGFKSKFNRGTYDTTDPNILKSIIPAAATAYGIEEVLPYD